MQGIVIILPSPFKCNYLMASKPNKFDVFGFQVVHRWVPNHPDARQRSHVDRVILLLVIEDKYVPIAESAVELVCFSEAKKDSASQDTETLSYPSADQPI